MVMCLTFLALSLIFTKDILATNNVRFTRNATFDGLNCTADQTVFNAEDVQSKLVCTSRCSESTSCFGVFYNRGKKDCTGCSFYMDVNAPARNGTEFHRRKGYELIKETKKWSEAKMHCIEVGGHLAYIKSLHEQAFVNDLMDQANVGNRPVWIGASDTITEGAFIWEDGTTLSGSFTMWRPGQPNNLDDQDCINLVKDSGKWMWGDYKCSNAALSLCEFN